MSCYRFLLDGVEVEEPQGFDGMTFKKERHATYFGFLHAGIGYSEVSEMTFDDEKAVGILKAAWKREGVQALVSLEILLGEQVVYSGNIDFAAAKVGSDSVSCTAKMSKSIRDFLTTAPNTLTVTPMERVNLPNRPDSALASHEIAPDFHTYSYKGTQEKDLSHYPVWETIKSGEDVQNYGVADDLTGLAWHTVPSPLRPIEENLNISHEDWKVAYNVTGWKEVEAERQDITVKVVGMVHLLAHSAAGGSYRIVLEWNRGPSYATDAGETTSQLTIAEHVLTPKPEESIIFFEETVTLQSVGAWLFRRGLGFRIISDVPSTDFSFEYQADSFLSVEIDTPVKSQPADPLFFEAESLIKELINRNTGLACKINLGLAQGEKAFISSGKNIRGLSSDFGISFEQLYKGLDNLLCLSLENENDTLILRPRVDLITNGIPYPLGVASELYEVPAENWTFSRVKVGFAEWQAESPFGLDEVNSVREYSTGIKAVEKELDIKSELIGSSYIIQEGRSRIGTDLAREDWSFDEKLFIVIAMYDSSIGGYRAKTGKDIPGSILNGSKAINLSLRPTEVVKRWLPLLSTSGPLTFSSGEGNYRAYLEAESESRSFQPSGQLLSRRAIECTVTMEMDTFSALGQMISIETDDGLQDALIQSIHFMPDTESSQAEIQAFLLA